LTEADKAVINFATFSKEHFEDYFNRIHPFNADRLAAVNVHLNPNINRMLESDVRELQNATIEIFRLAEVSALTPEERFLALRGRVETMVDEQRSWAFVDRAGHTWKNGNYFQMLNRTVSAKVARDSYNDALIGEGRDLVQVIGGTSPNSHPACVRWNGKLLSLTGATPGYSTVAEAEAEGLHHPNCVHTEVYVSDKTADGRKLIADKDNRAPRDVDLPKPKAKVGVGKDTTTIRDRAVETQKVDLRGRDGGFSFIHGDTPLNQPSNEWVDQMQGHFDDLPPNVVARLRKEGYSFHVGKELKNYDPVLAKIHPRGYPEDADFSQVDGFFYPERNHVVVLEGTRVKSSGAWRNSDNAKDPGLLYHEIGHSADQILGYPSGKKEFLEAYAKDKLTQDDTDREILGYFLQSGEAGPSETFAEGFANVFGANVVGTNEIKNAFPLTFKEIEKAAQSL